ncbi:19331_t:CDS:2, partial [Racocetra persica]
QAGEASFFLAHQIVARFSPLFGKLKKSSLHQLVNYPTITNWWWVDLSRLHSSMSSDQAEVFLSSKHVCLDF